MNCSLPQTGSGLSLAAVALVTLAVGFIVARTPRAHRMRVMLAIALPVAALALGSRSASAAADDCVTDTTEAPARATTTTVAPTTTVAATTTTVAPYTVSIEGVYATITVTGSGWTAGTPTGSPGDPSYMVVGTVAASSPTITISGSFDGYDPTTLTGGTCTVSGGGTGTVVTGTYTQGAAPYTCTLTGNFTIKLWTPT